MLRMQVTNRMIPRSNKQTAAKEFDLQWQAVVDAWLGLIGWTRLITCELLSNAVRSERRSCLHSRSAVFVMTLIGQRHNATRTKGQCWTFAFTRGNMVVNNRAQSRSSTQADATPHPRLH